MVELMAEAKYLKQRQSLVLQIERLKIAEKMARQKHEFRYLKSHVTKS